MALNIGGLAQGTKDLGLSSQGKQEKPKATESKKNAPVAESSGKPLMIPLEYIKEDETQPRQQMQDELLQELADSIKTYGIKQPVLLRSVGINQYIIIAGHRRFRASHIAGLKTIPAFLEESELDERTRMILQLTENIHREDLTDLEIAQGLQFLIDNGAKQKDLTKLLNKSKVFISEHLSMLKLPEFLLSAYREGKIKSFRTLMILQKPATEMPEELTAFINAYEGEIPRSAIESFLKPAPAPAEPEQGQGEAPQAEGQQSQEPAPQEAAPAPAGPEQGQGEAPQAESQQSQEPAPKAHQWKKPTFKVEYDGNDAIIMMHHKCEKDNAVCIKLDYDGHTKEVEIAALTFKYIQESD